MPESDNIKIQHDRLQPLSKHIASQFLGQGEKMPHVGQIRQFVMVELVVQVVDVVSDPVAHHLE